MAVVAPLPRPFDETIGSRLPMTAVVLEAGSDTPSRRSPSGSANGTGLFDPIAAVQLQWTWATPLFPTVPAAPTVPSVWPRVTASPRSKPGSARRGTS